MCYLQLLMRINSNERKLCLQFTKTGIYIIHLDLGGWINIQPPPGAPSTRYNEKMIAWQ